MFFFLWTVTRITGRSTLGELSTFELLLYVTMGDLVQQAVTQQDYSVTSAFLAVGVFTLLTVALSYSAWKWPRLTSLVKGSPVPVIEGGKMLPDAMRGQQVSFSDLATAARQQGIRRVSDIEVAVLEADGRMSFFTYEDEQSGSPESAPVG